MVSRVWVVGFALQLLSVCLVIPIASGMFGRYELRAIRVALGLMVVGTTVLIYGLLAGKAV